MSDLAERARFSRERIRQVLATEDLRDRILLDRFYSSRGRLGRPLDLGGPRDEWIECDLEDDQNGRYVKMPRLYNRRDRGIPADALYVGRGTPAGNPFVIGPDGDRDEVCDKFEAMVEADPALRRDLVDYCAGRDLVCWCAPARCHGAFLLRMANSPCGWRRDVSERCQRCGEVLGSRRPSGCYERAG